MTNIVVRKLQTKSGPWEIFKKIEPGQEFFFLDSALKGNAYSRYSFFGIEPFMSIKLEGASVVVRNGAGVEVKGGDPFEHFRMLLNKYKPQIQEDLKKELDLPFIGGAVGYFGYEMGRFIEKLPDNRVDDIGFPEMYFGFYDTFAAFDHETDKCLVVSMDFNEKDTNGAEFIAGEKADKLAEIILDSDGEIAGDADKHANDVYGKDDEGLVCNFTKEAYIGAVKKAKEYIFAGDIYQVNISQRFQSRTKIAPYDLYGRLRRVNPAPYSSFIGFDGLRIISSSPERFLSVYENSDLQNGYGKYRAQIRPIKGTRPRSNDEALDAKMKDELLKSRKDDAELTMIVDLERNDLGRVCDFGSVKVVERKTLESYSTVHHLVSTVEGDLSRQFDVVDLIKAVFPGGSITGAPKIRAMEIIDELETTKRSVYTGAIGYIGFDGKADLSMAIRILLMDGDKVYFQVGGGIVADSDPEEEYEETLHKAAALMSALGAQNRTVD